MRSAGSHSGGTARLTGRPALALAMASHCEGMPNRAVAIVLLRFGSLSALSPWVLGILNDTI